MISIVSVLVGLSLLSVILRIVARFERKVHFGMDDYLCFACMLLLIAMLIELSLCELLSDPTPLPNQPSNHHPRGHNRRQRIPPKNPQQRDNDELLQGNHLSPGPLRTPH